MHKRLIITSLISLSLSGCLHFDYAMDKKTSPVPYENAYIDDDYSSYEFQSTLYNAGSNKYSNTVDISHLVGFYQRYQSAPIWTWRSSALSFQFDEESGVEVLVDSIVLQHFSESGELLNRLG